MTLIAVAYGYACVSRADDESKILDTQLMLLAEHGIRADLVFSDVASGRNLKRTGWQELITWFQEGHTIVVAFLDWLSRNFEAESASGRTSPDATSASWRSGKTSTPAGGAPRRGPSAD